MADREVKAEEPTAAAAAPWYLVESPVPDQITARLPKRFVDWILNRKWVPFPYDPDEEYNQLINDPDRPEWYTQEYLEEERETMREMVEHKKRSWARFEEFQGWVRRQLDEKGFVEVGESYLKQCAVNCRSMPAEQDALMGGLMDELPLDEIKLDD